ncbi:kinase-like domain-containing protein [Zopfochytrium polystomum]|nr:kinase-like domain-containing protein [Zopfochytrium polystomum]
MPSDSAHLSPLESLTRAGSAIKNRYRGRDGGHRGGVADTRSPIAAVGEIAFAQGSIVSGYEIRQLVGEGANACVHMAIDPSTAMPVAIKSIRKQSSLPDLHQRVRKEVALHQNARHPNIVRLIGADEDELFYHLVLELAAGGELFDMIVPDVGVGEELAHFYFSQLVSGMTHLHQRGICHRDLKPENILIDESGNLKISDFGLATLFRHNNVTRVLTTPCGTPPYLAPEILLQRYHGDRVDIWSSGVILYVLLLGNTAWAQPTADDPEFSIFLEGYDRGLKFHPWDQLSNDVLVLLMGMLCVDEDRRFQETDIRNDSWFRRNNRLLANDGSCRDPAALGAAMAHRSATETERSVSAWRTADFSEDNEMVSESADIQPLPLSQPHLFRGDSDMTDGSIPQRPPGVVSFSQPSQGAAGNGACGTSWSQSSFFTAQALTRTPFQDLISSDRITRFISPPGMNPSQIIAALEHVLARLLVGYKLHPKLLKMSFSTVDGRRCPMNGSILIQPVCNDRCMVRFWRSKGDPIEFKRFYRLVTTSFLEVVR